MLIDVMSQSSDWKRNLWQNMNISVKLFHVIEANRPTYYLDRYCDLPRKISVLTLLESQTKEVTSGVS